MAHLLTFVWLAFWVAAQVLCLRLYSATSSRRTYWQTALLVSCLLIILFPVISNDDDLAWAKQIQVDFEAVGVTQATRAFSRFELPADAGAHAGSTVLLPPAFSYVARAIQLSSRPTSPLFHTEPVLRGPPSHF